MKPSKNGLDAETIAKAHQQFPQLKDLDDALEAVRQAKAAISDLPDRWAQDPSLTEDARWKMAVYLYYGCREMSGARLAHAFFGMQESEMVDRLRDLWLYECETCGERTVRGFNRWSIPRSCICDACREKERQESAQARAAHEHAEKESNARLRTMAYGAYLKTDHWRDLRRRMLYHAHYRCQVCNGQAGLEVHHRTYENRGDERLADLIVLCRDCHETHHKPSRVDRARDFEPSEEDLTEEDALP